MELFQYAGMMPIFWQLFNEETFITVTMHDLAHDIDAGRFMVNIKWRHGVVYLRHLSRLRLLAEIFADF